MIIWFVAQAQQLIQDAGYLSQDADDMNTMMASLADPDSEKYYTIYLHLYNI